jgi:hypothetical protein
MSRKQEPLLDPAQQKRAALYATMPEVETMPLRVFGLGPQPPPARAVTLPTGGAFTVAPGPPMVAVALRTNPSYEVRISDQPVLAQAVATPRAETEAAERRAKLEATLREPSNFLRVAVAADKPGQSVFAPLLTNVGIPDFGLKLVPFLVPRKLRDEVAGHLEEEFRKHAARWGRPYAMKSLCWDLVGLFLHRFAPASIIAGVAMWFRHKIGL